MIKKVSTLFIFLFLLANLFAGSLELKGYLNQNLTLDDVILLSKKGNCISFRDFRQYNGYVIGSGLLIIQYNIDDNFKFIIGGTGDNNVLYANLVYIPQPEYFIDIREKDVKTFIEECLNLNKN